MMAKKMIVSLLAVVAIIALSGVGACGSADTKTADQATAEKPASGTITTPGGNLIIESVEIKPHENNPDKQWVMVHLVPEEGTAAAASTIYESVERKTLMLRTEDGQEKAAVSISQSDANLQVGFITDIKVEEFTLLWPGNDPVRLDKLMGE